GISEKLVKIDYSFLGIDLGATPDWQLWSYSGAELAEHIGLFLIPLIAAGLTWAMSAVTQKLNPPADPQAAASTQSMQLMMPIMTLVFAFMMPAALGLYWAMGSLLSIVQEIVLTKHYKSILAVETAEHEAKRAAREAELEAKRKETERLKALNATQENESTSKKKKDARAKAEKERQEREWAQSQSGEEAAYEPSRVGHRKYARGRAYDPDRYTRNETASSEESEETGDKNA
ncbi:MAG: YidC/Oxa1 family membrane protein insertase, partial [bacterium]